MTPTEGSISDKELQRKLVGFGIPVYPVTETTRGVLIRKLKHLMERAEQYSNVTTTRKRRRNVFP